MTWRKIADEFSARIESGELLPGARLESEEQIAARVGVSRHTVHRALHELQRQGLLERKRRWGTVVAATAKPAGGKRIAYLVDFASNRFQADLMAHIEHALDEGTRLLVATSRNDLEREAEQLQKLSEEVDGIICYPCDGDGNARVFLELAESGFPLVLLDRAPRGCEDLVVLTDNVESSRLAVTDLIERGHEKIAFFGSNNDQAQSIRERYLGYRTAVEELGYPPRAYERWIPLSLDHNSDMMYQTIADALVALRSLPEPPTAAFCVQDWLAAGLLEACAIQGLEVGVDFGVATYNDFGPLFFRQPSRLDRVVQRIDRISVTAVERLRSLMAGETLPKGPVRVPALFVPAEDARAIFASSLSATAGVP